MRGPDLDGRVAGPFHHEIGAAFAVNALLARSVRDAVAGEGFPLVLAGDCSAALGALGGVGTEPCGVVWFDAHGDFNTPETTITGYFGGMPLAIVVGRGWTSLAATIPGFAPVPESRVVLAGVRALDPLEAELLAQSRVTVIGADALRRDGALVALRPGLAALDGVERVHIHVDMDVLDPTEVRANRYDEPGGLTLEVLREALRTAAAQHEICSVTLSAYDPTYDSAGRGAEAGASLLVALAEAVSSRHQG
ncbi:MAG TPA: arginase family protein [bacterium]|nr:arginase family protein [bacterium]